jgi:5-methylcytosine-specific restriction enzyme subunit McrC
MLELSENETRHISTLSVCDIEFLKKDHAKHLRIIDETSLCIRTSSYVGMIQLPSKNEIRILPKIKVSNLLYMISYTHSLVNFNYYDKKQITKIKSPLEIYIIIFLNWIELLVKKGLSKSYLSKTVKSSFIKGKLSITKSILSPEIPYCTYDKITNSTIENKILKSMLKLLLFKLLNSDDLGYGFDSRNKVKIKKRLLLYLEAFKKVEDIILHPLLFKDIKYSRNNYYYKDIIELSELIFTNTFISDKSGSKTFTGFLVDMNKVFEKFVFKVLQYNLSANNVSTKSVLSLTGAHADPRVPYEKPDIIIDNELVIDVKYYKEPLTRANKYRSEHLQQIKSYMYSNNLNGVLVYPENEKSYDSINETFQIPKSHLKVKIITFRLYPELEEFVKYIDIFIRNIENHFTSRTRI